MAALFSPKSNDVARGALFGALVVVVAVPVGLMLWVRTPAVTGEGYSPTQPIPFDHRIHVTGLEIDCRYCHATVERAATAGLPATETCLPCHSAVWLGGPLFAPVRQSVAMDRPIRWQRVHRLPDYVFFNHAIHVNGGIGCERCHGRVDRMAQIRQVAPLTMAWCVDCHRNPEPSRRPAEAVTTMGWPPTSKTSLPPLGAARREAIMTCSACHR